MLLLLLLGLGRNASGLDDDTEVGLLGGRRVEGRKLILASALLLLTSLALLRLGRRCGTGSLLGRRVGRRGSV